MDDDLEFVKKYSNNIMEIMKQKQLYMNTMILPIDLLELEDKNC